MLCLWWLHQLSLIHRAIKFVNASLKYQRSQLDAYSGVAVKNENKVWCTCCFYFDSFVGVKWETIETILSGIKSGDSRVQVR